MALPPEPQLPLPLAPLLVPNPPAPPSSGDVFHDNFTSSLTPGRWVGQQSDWGICVGLISLLPLSEAPTKSSALGKGG